MSGHVEACQSPQDMDRQCMVDPSEAQGTEIGGQVKFPNLSILEHKKRFEMVWMAVALEGIC